MRNRFKPALLTRKPCSHLGLALCLPSPDFTGLSALESRGRVGTGGAGVLGPAAQVRTLLPTAAAAAAAARMGWAGQEGAAGRACYDTTSILQMGKLRPGRAPGLPQFPKGQDTPRSPALSSSEHRGWPGNSRRTWLSWSFAITHQHSPVAQKEPLSPMAAVEADD